MKKRQVVVFLIGLMILLFPVFGQADGKCGDNLTWTLNNGKLEITGTGAMYAYRIGSDWGREEVTSVVISEGVTSIGDSAFSSCENLTSVSIPSTVTTIGEWAFNFCNKLTEITIPKSVTKIGERAFSSCESLTEIVIPDGVTVIPGAAFYYCTNLTSITLPKGITEIGSYAFSNCRKLKTLTLPESVESFGRWAFSGCRSLERISIPRNVKKLGGSAFEECPRLTGVDVDAENPFFTSKDGIVFNKNMTTIYYYSQTRKGAYAIPSSVTSIEAGAFAGCQELTGITFPDALKYIRKNAFTKCTGLTEAVLPYTVSTIEEDAFSYCSNLKSVTLSNWIEEIGKCAFFFDSELSDVYFRGTQEDWDNLRIIDHNDPLLKATLHLLDAPPKKPAPTGIAIDETHFPDQAFREAVKPFDRDRNGYLNDEELAEAEEISCPESAITSLKGIEHFTELKILRCYKNKLTELDISALTKLTELDCGENPISKLDTSKNTALQTLICGDTYLKALDVSGNPNLKKLMCEQFCYGWNELDSINVTACPALNNLVKQETYSDHTIPGHPYLYNHLLHGWWKAKSDDTLTEYLFVGPDVPVTTDEGVYISNKKKPEPEPEPEPEPQPEPEPRPDPKPDEAMEKIKAFVSRCYELILNRAADEGGLNGWSEALAKKTAAAANIIDGFIKSDEFKNRKLSAGESVDILYKTMLGRAADEGGKAGWVDALNQGYTLQHIINGFCASAEFTAICNGFGIEAGNVNIEPVNPQPDDNTPRGKIEAFVKRCYKLILNRDADQGGLQGWSDALEQRTAAAAQIIDGFVRSDEFVNRKLSTGESVDILYNTMLGRAADEGGKAGWVDALGQGFTLQHIINGFCGSPEFTAICDNYGIVAGSVAVSGAVVKREAITPEGEEEAAAVIVIQSEYTNEEKIRAFVEHCYVSVFGREGDAEGMENYTKLILDGKKSPKKVAYEFIFSPEFQNRLPGNEAFIKILYKLYFNREADAEDLTGWVQMLESGATLGEIVNGFAGSEEFKAIVNAMK